MIQRGAIKLSDVPKSVLKDINAKSGSNKKPNKFRNVKTTFDGIIFDSKAEAMRYQQLKLLERAGKISQLRLQPTYLLSPRTKTESKCEYKADFEYIEDGQIIVEDVKGHAAKEYIVKRKWFKTKYPDYVFREIKTSML